MSASNYFRESINNKSSNSFRVVSFNIAHGRAKSLHQILTSKKQINQNCREIGNFLVNTNADIVLLQEIDFRSFWSNHLHQSKIINHAQEFPYFCDGNHNISNQYVSLEYGNALLSKHQIIDNLHFSFEKKYLGGKGYQKACIQLQNKSITVFNLHLHPISNKIKAKQLQILGEVIENTPKPFLIGGDFNMKLNSKILQNFINDFELLAPMQPLPTFQFLNMKKQIDFIFGSNDIQWQAANVPDVKLSDHYPLVQDFVFC